MDVMGLLSLMLIAQAAVALPREYLLVNLRKSWPEAQSYCRENAYDLATIQTAEEQDRVEAMMVNCIDTVAWIGLYDDVDSWRWSMDNTYLFEGGNINLGSWFVFERNNYASKQHCATISNGVLYDSDCPAIHKSVCYDEPSNTYILVTVAMTWPAAQSYCRETYTDLASIRSEQELNDIMSVIDTQSTWIGLSRDVWKWSDQSSYTFSKWDGGDPNSGVEDCVDVHVGGWFDRGCAAALPFFCEVTRRRILNVVVKTNTSVDLNDLQVQEEILNKMEGRLANQGLSQGIRLSWRKQPNGNVFNKTQTEL